METAAATLSRGSSDDGLKGLVRVSAPPTLGQRFLAAELAKLSVKHPGLDLDVSTDLRNVSLERRETDVALRLGRLQDGDVIAKLLATLGFGFYASAKWCGRINDGVQPVFVGFDEANSYLPEAAWLARHFPRARVSFRTNNQLGQAEAAAQDAGIALLPQFLGRLDNRLHSCRLDRKPPPRELWVVTRRQDLKDLPVRTIVDYLSDLFRQKRKLFEEESEDG